MTIHHRRTIPKRKSLAGITPRKGRPPAWLTFTFDQIADNAFKLAGRFMRDAEAVWETLTLDDKIKVLQVASPIAMKRIPDRQEIVQVSINASSEDFSKLCRIAEFNMSAIANMGERHTVLIKDDGINLNKNNSENNSEENNPSDIIPEYNSIDDTPAVQP